MRLPNLIDLLTHNWALKIAALALAVLLWTVVQADTNRQVPVAAPVQVDIRDPDWSLARPPQPGTVRVTLRGSLSDLAGLGVARPRVILPVEEVNDTTEVHRISASWVQFDRTLRAEVTVTQIEPNQVELRFQPIESKAVPLVVTTRGRLPEGYGLEVPVQIDPSSVQVRGPAGDIAAIDSLRLEPINLSEMRGVINVPTTVDTTGLSGLEVSPMDVRVLLRVAPLENDSLPADSVVGSAGRPAAGPARAGAGGEAGP